MNIEHFYFSEKPAFDDSLNIIKLNYPRCILKMDHKALHQVEDWEELDMFITEAILSPVSDHHSSIEFLDRSKKSYSPQQIRDLIDEFLAYFKYLLDFGQLDEHAFEFGSKEDDEKPNIEVPIDKGNTNSKKEFDSFIKNMEGEINDEWSSFKDSADSKEELKKDLKQCSNLNDAPEFVKQAFEIVMANVIDKDALLDYYKGRGDKDEVLDNELFEEAFGPSAQIVFNENSENQTDSISLALDEEGYHHFVDFFVDTMVEIGK